MAYNFTKVSGVYRVTDTTTNAVPKSYFGAVNISIGADNYTVPFTSLKVNGQQPSTASEAMTLLTSLFGS